MIKLRTLLFFALFIVLAACDGEPSQDGDVDAGGAHDPVMAAAIEGPLMVDPDLSQANNRNLAVVPPGPGDPALPLPDDQNK